MCDPLTIALVTTAASAGSAIMSFQGQRAAKKANDQAANMTYANTYNELGNRNIQIDQQQSENSVEAAINQHVLQGRISASAGAMGLTGGTTKSLEVSAANQVGRALSLERLTSENQRIQQGTEYNAAGIRRVSQINSVAKPSIAKLGFDLAKSGLQGANAYSDAGGKF